MARVAIARNRHHGLTKISKCFYHIMRAPNNEISCCISKKLYCFTFSWSFFSKLFCKCYKKNKFYDFFIYWNLFLP